MEQFHFLRPYCLALLPLLPVLWWWLSRHRAVRGAWERIVEKHLAPYVLAARSEHRSRYVSWLATLGLALAIIALAGPTWRQLPQPVFQAESAMVIALDLSRSMDATDITPTRLVRARHKLIDILERREEGQTALIVYAAQPFVVSPLTTDTVTIRSLVMSLSSDIMPAQGSRADRAMEQAAELMRRAGMASGDILLITDGVDEGDAPAVAARLRGEGFRVSVLGVGTRSGAPVPLRGGSLLKDREGQIVVPRLDSGALRQVAARGGGRYRELRADDRDIDQLFSGEETGGLMASDDDQLRTDLWQEEGPWLLLPLLPLAALVFRRGFLAVFLLAWLWVPPADALEWQELWQRDDQRAVEALEAGEAEQAAELFQNPEWKAAALYRAGEYGDSASLLEGQQTARALYNRGNALARAGQFGPAIQSYEAALELDPADEDARYNLELLRQLMPPQSGGEGQQEGDPGSGQEQPEGGDPGAQGEQRQDGQRGQQQNADQGQDAQRDDPSAPEPSQDGSQAQQQGQQDTAEGEGQQGEEGTPGDVPGLASIDDSELESERATEQWLRRIPDDPGGLLRRKFLYQYRRSQQAMDDEGQPW